MKSDPLHFPADFLWGTAASAYQIEGACNEDGKGPSIWDDFCKKRGKVRNGETGDIAVDHYHRWLDDITIMSALGLKAYRFSIAWSRVLPAGKGQVNSCGLDFYERLVDALLARGIEPIPTLFHYDLPLALQRQGGWPRRETAEAFGEYATVVGQRLGDRINTWITHNEPLVTAITGHLTGEHAPGWRNPFAAFQTLHHLLLSHGLAVEALRATSGRPTRVGIALNLTPMHPATDKEPDQQAARLYDGVTNRLLLDPLLKGNYPEDILQRLGFFFASVIRQDDMARIAAPLDFVGVNYYTRMVIRSDWRIPLLQGYPIRPQGSAYSPMWEIYAPGIYELLSRIWNDYRPRALFVTENGIPVHDQIDTDGRVRDIQRIQYLQSHLAQVHRALAEGIPIMGYLVWSLLDNFEWNLGYQMRFGLVHVDYKTLARTIKESGYWFAQLIQNRYLLTTDN